MRGCVLHGLCPISIHALREEGDQSQIIWASQPEYFYPRPPRGGRLNFESWMATAGEISIHALREEGDSATFSLTTIRLPFLSTPSARRATQTAGLLDRGFLFLSTPSARRATLSKYRAKRE